ncbi:MAG: hypothetical protein K8S25_02055 [Alphaproteobacteria bacterium]|nr:hypothetical protein [Alphaproteobacteria bacterium]
MMRSLVIRSAPRLRSLKSRLRWDDPMTSRLNSTFAAVIALTTLQMLQPVHAREVLIPLRDCPTTGPQRACLPENFLLSHNPDNRILSKNTDSEIIAKRYLITGRLSGGAAHLFQLDITRGIWDEGADTTDNPGVLPYRGRSSRNRPIILTTRGPLEILTKEFDAELSQNLFVIDEKNWRVVANFQVLYDWYLKTSLSKVKAWNKREGVCVSAAQKKPGPLTLSATGCNPSQTLTDASGFFHTPTNLERVIQLLPELSFFSEGEVDDNGATIQIDSAFATVSRSQVSYLVIYTGCSDCE